MNRTAVLLLILIFVATLAWGSSPASAHELTEDAQIVSTCVDWEHSVSTHRQDVFDAVEFAARETAEKVNKSEKFPHEIAQAIELCVTDTENTDTFISSVNNLCASAPEEIRGTEQSLHTAVTVVSTDLFQFCILSSIAGAYPGGEEVGI